MHKILVVDDEADLLKVIEIFLLRRNFAVKAIAKWEDIQTSIRSFNPDLVLLDISLKGADGRIICKELKTNEETKNLPVLLFSANYKVKETLAEFLADGFIEKPFDISNLVDEIHLILARYNNISS